MVDPFSAFQMTPLALYPAASLDAAKPVSNVFQSGCIDWTLLPSYHRCCFFSSPFIQKKSFLEALPSVSWWVNLFPTAPAFQSPLTSYANANHLPLIWGQEQLVLRLHPQMYEEFSWVKLVLLKWIALFFLIFYTGVLLDRSWDWHEASTALFQKTKLFPLPAAEAQEAQSSQLTLTWTDHSDWF